jgi:NADH/NAD ratio-sensing transcriptional regulator Rex
MQKLTTRASQRDFLSRVHGLFKRKGHRYSSAELAESLSATQAQVRRALNTLCLEGKIQYEGVTRNVRYFV